MSIQNLLKISEKWLPRVSIFSTLGTFILIIAIGIFIFIKNPSTSGEETDSASLYLDKDQTDSLLISSKTLMESFDSNGFVPEGPIGTEPNIPPGYKDRDYQKANYIKDGRLHSVPVQAQQTATDQKVMQNTLAIIEVSNVKDAISKLKELTQALGGFIEKEAVQQDEKERLISDLVIRVRAENTGKMLAALEKTGNIKSLQNKITDVTADYKDFRLRLENQQKLRASILRILGQKTGSVKEVIEGTKELAAITENIEGLQGTLKGYDDKIAFSTLNIRLHEPSAIMPSRSESSGRKLLGSFIGAGYVFVDFLSILIKSLGVLLPIGLLGYWLYRRKTRSPKVHSPKSQSKKKV